MEDGAKIILITRPRRFGKTINMSMLQHFLAAEVGGLPTKDLFNDLLISKDPASMVYQGKYPDEEVKYFYKNMIQRRIL